MAANGGMMPDLQLRMSKKIAQLTKVIYHLNNKNEDHDMDLAEMADQYESEIETVLRDTADKLNAFQAALDSRREELRIQEVIKKLTARHEEAKAAALADFADYKARTKEREAELIHLAETTTAKLSSEVEALKVELQQLAGGTAELSKAATADSRLRAELERAKEELQEAVMEGNSKYNSMIAERLQVEDDLKAEIKRLKAEGLAQKREMQADVEAQRKLVREEKEHWETKFKQADSNWKGKIEGLLDELTKERSRNAELGSSASASDKALAAVHEQLALAKAEIEKKAAEAVRVGKDLEAAREEMEAIKTGRDKALRVTEEQVAALGRKVQELEAELTSSRSMLGETDKARAEHEAAAKAELKSLHAKLAGVEEALKTAFASSEGFKSKVEELQMALATAENKHGADQQAAATEKADLERAKAVIEKSLRDSQARVTALESSLKEAMAKGREGATEAADRVKAEMEQQMKALRAQHAEETKSLKATHLEAIKGAEKDADEALKRRVKELTEDRRSAEAKLRDDADRLLAQAEERMSQTRAELEEEAARLEEERKRLEQRVKALEGKVAADAEVKAVLEGRLQDVEKNTSTHVQDLQAELRASRDALKRAESDLEGTCRDLAASEAKRGALEGDLAALRKEMEMALRKAEEQRQAEREEHSKRSAGQLEGTVVKKDQEMRDKMAALEATLAAKAATDLKEQAARHKAEMEDLKQRNDRAITEERARAAAALQAAQASAAGDMEALKAAHDAEQERLKQVKAAQQSEMEEREQRLRAEAEKALRDKETQLSETERAAAEKLHAELAAAAAAASAELEAAAKKAAQEQEEMAAAREAALADVQRRNEELISNLRKEASQSEARLRAEAKQAEEALRAQAARDAAAAEQRAEAAARAAGEKHQQECAELNAKISAAQSSHSKLQGEFAALQATSQQTMAALGSTQRALADKAAQMAQQALDHKQAAAAAAAEAEELREALIAKHVHDTDRLLAGHADAMQQAELRHVELEKRFGVLETRFNARESREEDVERIKQLEALCAHQEKEVVFIREQMEKIKAELLLREDNYNNTFANGGAGKAKLNVGKAQNAQNATMDWMLGKKKSNNGRNNGAVLNNENSTRVTGRTGSGR